MYAGAGESDDAVSYLYVFSGDNIGFFDVGEAGSCEVKAVDDIWE